MKMIPVIFPDGFRDWPARQRFVPSKEIPAGPGQIMLEPVPHPDWKFQPVAGGWRADPSG